MVDFNDSKHTYKDMIDDSIRFSGKDLNFFVMIKAYFLKKIVKKYMPSVKKPRILDIGCGHGFIHSYLTRENFEVFGIEMADEVLELARHANPDVSYSNHDGKTIPFQSNMFDITIAICVMHHVPPLQWHNFLIEMKRVLKPGGIAVIFEHNPNNPLTRHVVSKNALDNEAVLLRNTHLEHLMQEAGFKTADSRFIIFTPFSLSVFRWFDSMLWWCPLGAQYYTVAKV